MTFDQLLNKCTPNVQSTIKGIVDEAGTTDANWRVFEAAGKQLAFLIERNRLLEEFVADRKVYQENERLRTLLDSLMQEIEITDTATAWKRITSAVKPEHAEALEQYFREWEARDE